MKTKEVDYKTATDGTRVIADDPWLAPYAQTLRDRFSTFQHYKNDIIHKEGSVGSFGEGYKRFGLLPNEAGVQYREWVPQAKGVSLVGDFNHWNESSHSCRANEFGVWELFIPNNPDGSCPIPHYSKIKTVIYTHTGKVYRNSPWVRYLIQEKGNPYLEGLFWNPPPEYTYTWKHKSPPKPESLRIYESHVGMASEQEKIGTYKEFEENILPYIADLGYNCIQLMAVMEHSYYASFGYQVTNFFAPTSRCGTPEDLKSLVDKAHELGITVLLDLVHSHASKNTEDGLNEFDGTDGCYFHSGPKGTHQMWDSRIFNYNSWEVLRFLLSNLRFWIDIYRFDGFRFDGVTAMLLHNRSVGELPNDYPGYFGPGIDGDALRYLTLANDMLHELYPNIITIAEDATGFACLCRPTQEGGVGFDYRLAMGLPDKWKKLMKTKDQDWNLGSLTHELGNRRHNEATVGYVESHDQALVGDKTVAFWLMDKDMYTHMSVLSDYIPTIDRGVQLHKLIRLLTCALGGEAYLTFMGNEFGHPEWIDFPREGNNDSYHYCCRRWYLMRDPLLRYQQLHAFEKAMIHTEIKYGWLGWKGVYVGLKHESDKIISFEKNKLLFVFNFNPTQSFPDYPVPVQLPGKYELVLDSDQPEFGGHNRIDPSVEYFSQPSSKGKKEKKEHSIKLYLPARCAFVLHLVE